MDVHALPGLLKRLQGRRHFNEVFSSQEVFRPSRRNINPIRSPMNCAPLQGRKRLDAYRIPGLEQQIPLRKKILQFALQPQASPLGPKVIPISNLVIEI